MNREILFRGKRIDNDEWVYGLLVYMCEILYIVDSEIYNILDNDFENLAHAVKPKTIGQYTGLTDKNGKKIFEGDILRYTWDTLSGEKKPYTYVISYNDKEARFIGECDSDDLQHLLPTFKYVGERGEVIGNVYDNPELWEAYND